MARGSSVVVSPPTPEEELVFDPSEIMLFPMHRAVYKQLADSAMRDGIPLLEFVQRMFERAIREGVRGK